MIWAIYLPDRDDTLVVVFEVLSDLLGLSYALLVWGTRSDWLLEEDWGVGEVCGELEFQVPGSGETASKGRWCSDKDGPGISTSERDSSHR